MGVETLISIDEYLRSSYSPDKEYVDGVLVEINVGDWQHGMVQSNVIFAVRLKYPTVKVVPELRSRTRETRFRLPDVAVVLHPPVQQGYLAEPPFLAIEILSPADRLSRLIDKLKEYAEWGVQNIWMLDPAEKRMFVFVNGELLEIEGEAIGTNSPRVELTRAEIFQE
jgi:Uma2 family endonuclease